MEENLNQLNIEKDESAKIKGLQIPLPVADSSFFVLFPNYVYRYHDGTGNNRKIVKSAILRPDLNEQGYCSYFTVNGFGNFKTNPSNEIAYCTNINGFWVDIDGRKDLEELEQIKDRLDPTFINETQNGYHIFWVLDEPIFKSEIKNWDDIVNEWNRIEQNIVKTLDGDTNAQDLARILRVPDTFYWKNSGEAYKNGTEGVFKIKTIYSNQANTYSFEQIKEAFPFILPSKTTNKRVSNEDSRTDFFRRLNEKFGIEERGSFQKLISGEAITLPPNAGRNNALVITASLMRQAGWKEDKAHEYIKKTGWHGIEKERGGQKEIWMAIHSAYTGGYIYSLDNEIIKWNTDEEEKKKLDVSINSIFKDRKEIDKLFFSDYEYTLYERYPNLKKDDSDTVFDYHNGVYKVISESVLRGIIFNNLYDDMLWGFRTRSFVSDKYACLLSIIPLIELSMDHNVVNLKNGLLNLKTKEILPHTPLYVSTIQLQVSFDREAICPEWESCVDFWMSGEGEEEKKELLQQFAGYILMPTLKYHKSLFLVGEGNNGKSTLVEVLMDIIGSEYVSHLSLNDMNKNFGLDLIVHKILNIGGESKYSYQEGDIYKKITSGEKITADVKGKKHITFVPTVKLIFPVNKMPRISDNSFGLHRRMLIIYFNNILGEEKINTELRQDIRKEHSGILNWMLKGYDSLEIKKKFIETNENKDMITEFKNENSSLESFLDEECEYNKDGSEYTKKIYERYIEYCRETNFSPKKRRAFVGDLIAISRTNRKFKFEKESYGGAGNKFVGLKLLDLRSYNPSGLSEKIEMRRKLNEEWS